MANSLSGCTSAIHTNVETPHRCIRSYYLVPQSDQKLIDRTSLWLEQVEEGRRVPFRYYEGV
jgi:hypothetical protein